MNWTVTPLKRKLAATTETEKDEEGSSSKKPRTGEKDKDGKQVCKPHNDNRGCTAKQADCPLHRAHKCDVLREDGVTICGSTEHKRSTCPLRKLWVKP